MSGLQLFRCYQPLALPNAIHNHCMQYFMAFSSVLPVSKAVAPRLARRGSVLYKQATGSEQAQQGARPGYWANQCLAYLSARCAGPGEFHSFVCVTLRGVVCKVVINPLQASEMILLHKALRCH